MPGGRPEGPLGLDGTIYSNTLTGAYHGTEREGTGVDDPYRRDVARPD